MFEGFGNKVKIKSSPETKEKGLDGKVGEVYGMTTPSISGVDVIGTPQIDYAVNVYFEDIKTAYWFDEDLIEQVDGGKGSVITLDGINKKWTQGENGEWIEEDMSSI